MYGVLALVVAPQAATAAEPLHASLAYSIRAAPYQNSVHLNVTGTLDTRIAVDRDPSSPYYGTIYVLRGYSSPPADFKIRRSLDGGRTFGDSIPVDLCAGFNDTTCDVERPGIAVGNGGAAYIVDPNLATGEVAVLRSVDRGLSARRVECLGTLRGRLTRRNLRGLLEFVGRFRLGSDVRVRFS